MCPALLCLWRLPPTLLLVRLLHLLLLEHSPRSWGRGPLPWRPTRRAGLASPPLPPLFPLSTRVRIWSPLSLGSPALTAFLLLLPHLPLFLLVPRRRPRRAMADGRRAPARGGSPCTPGLLQWNTEPPTALATGDTLAATGVMVRLAAPAARAGSTPMATSPPWRLPFHTVRDRFWQEEAASVYQALPYVYCE